MNTFKMQFCMLSMWMLMSFQALALDFKEIISDTVKEQIEQKTGSANADETGSKQVQSDQIKSRTLPAFNWKSPSKTEEIALGREITGNLLGAAPLVKDAALQAYVNKVGRWVASQSDRTNLPWRFGIIESNDINAFAVPGGYVLVTKGLYQKLQNEAQLAGVLAHEIGHIVKKHQLKVLQKQQLLNIGAQFLNKKYAKDNALVSDVIGSGAEISARSLDKNAEFEADRLGITYATRAGYEALGLAEVLQMLEQTNAQDSSLALLFKTHPLPEARLVALNESIGNRLDKINNGKSLESRFYRLK